MTRKTAPPYRKRFIPAPLKALFLKFWVAGAVYFFVGWGTFIASIDQLDLTFAIGIIIGLMTDIITNRILGMWEDEGFNMKPFRMFEKRTFLTVWLNVVYGILLAFVVAYTYNIINVILLESRGVVTSDPTVAVPIPLGAEPILFGLFFIAWDMVFITIKRFFKDIIKSAKDEKASATAKASVPAGKPATEQNNSLPDQNGDAHDQQENTEEVSPPTGK